MVRRPPGTLAAMARGLLPTLLHCSSLLASHALLVRQVLMKAQLERIYEGASSTDTKEIVTKALKS